MQAGLVSVIFRPLVRNVNRRYVREFAQTLARALAGGREFHCLITGDDELRRLNYAFLGEDYATDVLSFPSQDQTQFLGDIAISWQRARAQALERGHSTEEEIALLMLHGMLHLLGMDHATDRGAMARAERRWRKHLGLPGGLIERSSR